MMKGIITPFKWLYPMLESVPEQCLELLDSPVSVILGLTIPTTELNNRGILTKYRNIIFYDIDNKKFFNNS